MNNARKLEPAEKALRLFDVPEEEDRFGMRDTVTLTPGGNPDQLIIKVWKESEGRALSLNVHDVQRLHDMLGAWIANAPHIPLELPVPAEVR